MSQMPRGKELIKGIAVMEAQQSQSFSVSISIHTGLIIAPMNALSAEERKVANGERMGVSATLAIAEKSGRKEKLEKLRLYCLEL